MWSVITIIATIAVSLPFSSTFRFSRRALPVNIRKPALLRAAQEEDFGTNAAIAALSALNGIAILPNLYYTARKLDAWKPKVVDEALKKEVATHIEYGSMITLIYDIFEQDENSVNVGRCYLGKKANINEVFKRLYPGFEVETLLKANPRGLKEDADIFTFFGLTAFNEKTGELVVVYRGTVTNSEKVEDTRALGSKWKNIDTKEIQIEKDGDGDVAKWDRFTWGYLTGAETIVVHRGFKGVYSRAVPNKDRGGLDSPQIRLRGVIDKYGSKIKKITVTGHSLGAATAVVTGLDLAQYLERKKLPTKLEIISFACPMTGDDKLGKEFARLGVRHVHYLNRGDVVPSGMLGRYKHDSIQEERRLIPAWDDERRIAKKEYFDKVYYSSQFSIIFYT